MILAAWLLVMTGVYSDARIERFETETKSEPLCIAIAESLTRTLRARKAEKIEGGCQQVRGQ